MPNIAASGPPPEKSCGSTLALVARRNDCNGQDQSDGVMGRHCLS
jgi:hypothetical protein